MTQDLLNRYDALCAEILRHFCQKQEAQAEPSPWVSDIPGGMALVADRYFDFRDILDDLRLEAPRHEIFRWHDHATDCAMLGIHEQPNYRTWLSGYHGTPQEAIDRIRKARQELQDIIDSENQKSKQPQ